MSKSRKHDYCCLALEVAIPRPIQVLYYIEMIKMMFNVLHVEVVSMVLMEEKEFGI
jgi:hypothetical protein